VVHPWPAPVNPAPLRRIFPSLKAFAAIGTLPFLAGFAACERHGGGEAGADAVVHPAPSSPLTSATPAATVLADKATPAVTVTAAADAIATATPNPSAAASAAPTPEPSASVSVSAPASSPEPPEPSATDNANAAGPSPAPSSPTPVPAPHFASAAANEYVQVYDAYVRNFETAYIRMMKDADLSDYGRLIAQAQELQVKGEQIEEELDPGEREAFGKYLDAKAEEIRRITSEAL